jgi:sialate O-acetylesterase
MAHAELRLPSIFSDHMVIQRNMPVEVWGWADPGSRVAVSLKQMKQGLPRMVDAYGTSDEDGRWSVVLSEVSSTNDNWTLTIEEYGEADPKRPIDTKMIEDVLVGEVWICGGQSNMEWTIDGIGDQAGDKRALTRPRMRLIKAPHVLATDPQENIEARWEVCTERTVGNWSAVGFFFGDTLMSELDVPIGLISTNWGGTRIEPWIERADLAAHPMFSERTIALQDEIATYESITEADSLQRRDAISRQRERKATRYWTQIMEIDPGHVGGWMNPEFDDDGWNTMELPAEWENAEPDMVDFDGTVWFRKTVEIPRSWRDKTLELELGRIDDSDRTYVNGLLIGSSTNLHNTIRTYEIDPEAIGKGSVTIAVCVMDPHGAGGFTGPSMTLTPKGEDLEGLDLHGPWRCKEGVASTLTTNLEGDAMRKPGMTPQSPGTLHDAMIAPFVPYGVQGAIWYQGESNSGQAEEYRELLPLLIESWREDFGAHLAFGIVQLAAFKPFSEDPDQGGWAHLRDAQLHAFKTVPGTGLAVTTDVGNANDIHPRRKKPVGERLGWWALHDVYGKESFTPSGPIASKVVADGNRVTITFEHAEGGLFVPRRPDRVAEPPPFGGDWRIPDGFALAGDDGVFHWAKARFRGTNGVELYSNEVQVPRIVSYGWQDNPVRTNVMNSAGLPASPFKIPVE